MGISASYIGPNGGMRTFDLEGAPEPGSAVASLLAAQMSRMPALPGISAPLAAPTQAMPQMPEIPSLSDEADRGKVKVTDGDIPDVLARKLAQNGSIVAAGNMLCLRGEEGGTPGGSRVYGVKDGVGGYHTLAQMDPYAGGAPMVGSGDVPDGNSASLDGSNGATVRLGGRTYVNVEVTPDGKRWLVIKEFYRMADITPNGRIARISKEMEALLIKQPLGGEGGSGNGKYGVKPFFADGGDDAVHPIPDAFAFGTEENLDTWNEDTGRFECNYNDGELVEDPPVKVVVTIPNTGGGVQ